MRAKLRGTTKKWERIVIAKRRLDCREEKAREEAGRAIESD